MKGLVGTLSVLALLAAGPALAEEGTAQRSGNGASQYAPGELATMGDLLTAAGTVSKIDQEARTLALENGMTFEVAEDTRLTDIGEGSDVIVAYQEQDGRMVATRIEPPTEAQGEQSAETGQ